MTEKVLFVDDEPNVLSALQRQFRKHYDVSTALGGVRALHLIAHEGPFAVIVTDMQMPEMNGVQFLREARKLAPDSVRLMLTGNADQQTAMDAVNEGSVFAFLTKPCPPEIMVRSMQSAVDQYHLITAERELLEGTLNGSVNLLMDLLSMVAPEVFGHTRAIQGLVTSLSGSMQLEDPWDLEMGAMLCNIACVTLPPETLAKARSGEALSSDEQLMLKRLPETGRNLITNIPRLERVADIVFYQDKAFDGSGFPEDTCSADDIPRESRILKVLRDLEDLAAQGMLRAEALEQMRGRDGIYDPVILQAVSTVLAMDDNASAAEASVEIKLFELRIGHVLVSDVETVEGKLLIAAGNTITAPLLERLHNYRRVSGIKEPILILSEGEAPDTVAAVAM
ncbi:MAG: HD domain-containing phosphohydrolase [Gammaproteobacteria bacterium]